MASGAPKGSVTPLGSYFSPEETQKAAQRVEDAISGRREELRRLQSFISDNSNLISLVLSLPDETSHDIMVPFGGAAFFPGRLIHTNELLVLLGDNYYAERSAKQTIDILKRREKALEDQVEAVKATMLNLEAEAKFFKSTAAEASEGIVEITEEYIEEPQSTSPKSDYLQRSEKDEELEHARIIKLLNQLEMKELESGSVSGDEDESKFVALDGDEDAETTSSHSIHDNERYVSQKKIKQDTVLENFGSEEPENSLEQHLVSQSSILKSEKHSITEASLFGKKHSDIKAKAQPMSDIKEYESSSDNMSREVLGMGSDTRKAFTGSVIERDIGQSGKSTATGQSSTPNPSKPVSRFKMQRSNR